ARTTHIRGEKFFGPDLRRGVPFAVAVPHHRGMSMEEAADVVREGPHPLKMSDNIRNMVEDIVIRFD
ncbi:unnamed protein product, partial [Allacma fusca]